jgi:hypothetical protein
MRIEVCTYWRVEVDVSSLHLASPRIKDAVYPLLDPSGRLGLVNMAPSVVRRGFATRPMALVLRDALTELGMSCRLSREEAFLTPGRLDGDEAHVAKVVERRRALGGELVTVRPDDGMASALGDSFDP